MFFDELFDEEERIKDDRYVVREINPTIANEIVKRFHYSGKVVSNSSLHLGIYCSGLLVGCLQFGYPMNGDKTSSKISKTHSNMFELNRMVMDDNQPRNSESRALGMCLRWLKQNRKDIDYILSFSDGKEGNVGYIYQASNWTYLGYMLSDSFYELDGEIMHSVTVWHKYKEKHPDRDVKTTHEILFDNYDNVSRISSKQHIYVFPLNKKVKFEFDKKPYPKKDKEIPIVSTTIYKKDGVVLTQPHRQDFDENLESLW